MTPETAVWTAALIYAALITVPTIIIVSWVTVDALTVPPSRAVCAVGLPPAPPDYGGARRRGR